MVISGKLKEDIQRGDVTIVLGAGVGISAGLYGSPDLSEYLFKASGLSQLSGKSKNLAKLVSALDAERQFTRTWTNEKLLKYFNSRKHYTNLPIIRRFVLSAKWKAIFTTNYDLSLEFSCEKDEYLPGGRTLVPISNANERSLIHKNPLEYLRYFKLHGCAGSLANNPTYCSPLVLTQRDFVESIPRNKYFWQELKSCAYNGSVIFIGFNIQRTENSFILASVQDFFNTSVQTMQDSYRPFAVLPFASPEEKEDLEELGVNLLEGTLEDLLNVIDNFNPDSEQPLDRPSVGTELISYKTKGGVIEFSQTEIREYGAQFEFYHAQFFKTNEQNFETLSVLDRISIWKSKPPLIFSYSSRPIKRDCFALIYKSLLSEINHVAKTSASRIFFLEGSRGSGKSILAHLLGKAYYHDTLNHVLLLNPESSILEIQEDGSELQIPGWNSRLVDKFLSQGMHPETTTDQHVTLLIADHCAHLQLSLDALVRQLGNHGKKVLVLLTINPDEYVIPQKSKDKTSIYRLRQHYGSQKAKIPHDLSDVEINLLFDQVGLDCGSVQQNKDKLIFLAKETAQANRDLLLVLYLWFDKHYRRLEEIIVEESAKLEENNVLCGLYLSIAVFHQYNLTPPIQLCLEANGITINQFEDLKNNSFFNSFISLSSAKVAATQTTFTRHPSFTRKILHKLLPKKEDQVSQMEKVMGACEARDLSFVRNFFDYLFSFALELNPNDIALLKKATELKKIYANDVIINHKYASYLIREKVHLEEARYYLDLAMQESNGRNVSIIHTLGNLHYAKFSIAMKQDNFSEGHARFKEAKRLFSLARISQTFPDEYVYVTDYDMTRDLLDATPISNTEERSILQAEQQSLMFEAMQMVPKENHNYLSQRVSSLRPFNELDVVTRKEIESAIWAGNAATTLLRYYFDSLFKVKEPKSWRKAKDLFEIYDKNDDIHTIVFVGILSKLCFLRTAHERFDKLRHYYDRLVIHREEQVGMITLSNYIRLLQVDAFVLEKYDFLRNTFGHVREAFKFVFPRFLKDEFILKRSFYEIDLNEEDVSKRFYVENSQDFLALRMESCLRFNKTVNLQNTDGDFFDVIIDPVSRLHIRGIRKELTTDKRRFDLSFSVKHAFDGLKVTGFRI